MEGNPPPSPWSPWRVLAAPILSGAVRDPVGLYLVPLLLTAPLMAISILEAEYPVPLPFFESIEPNQAVLLFTVGFVGVFLACIAQALVSRRTAELLHASAAASLEADFRQALRRSPAYLALVILLLLIIAAGLLALVVPGFIALYLWGFAPVACAVEGTGVIASFRRSRMVVRGRAGRWTGSMLLLLLVYLLVTWGAFWIFEFFPSGLAGGASGVTATIVQTVLFEVISLVLVVSWTSLYLHLRAEKEPSLQAAVGPAAEEETGHTSMVFE